MTSLCCRLNTRIVLLEMLEGGVDVDRVPKYEGVDDGAEDAELIRLAFSEATPDFSTSPVTQCTTELRGAGITGDS